MGRHRLLVVFAGLVMAACGRGAGQPGSLTTATPLHTAPPLPAATVTEVVTATETVTATAEPTGGETGSTGGKQTGPCAQLGPERQVPLPVLFVTRPAVGQRVASGFTVEGCTNAFEAAFSWELVGEPDGTVLADGTGTASCGTGCLGTFRFTVTYAVDEETIGRLRVFTRSAEDNSVQDLNAIPLRLVPS